MAQQLLSQHSSNPLESSQTKRRRVRMGHASSDQLNITGSTPTKARPVTTKMSEMIDLDESDDEDMLDGQIDRIGNVEETEQSDLSDSDQLDMVDSSDEERDEEQTIWLRPESERLEIEAEIADLEIRLPMLRDDYKLVDRLGTGTFSSVYKALDINHHAHWDNAPWRGIHPPESSAHYQSMVPPANARVWVAIKRIYVTSSPERIRNEIAILLDCRGCRHTCQLITAYRQEDQVVAIMPYQNNEDFRVSTVLMNCCMMHC